MEKGFTITYEYGDNLYVNPTNRCNFNCEFCLRHGKAQGSIYTEDSLWLEHEPSRQEAMDSFLSRDVCSYREIVFCGYGEPTYRLDDILWLVDQLKARFGDKLPPVRINTNGHANLILGRDVCPELKGRIDTVSISLNAVTPREYVALCHPVQGEAAYQAMLDFAREHGLDYVVTGHYARIEQDPATGRWLLKKALYTDKDQSYVLYVLTQDQLAHTKFPLGGMDKPSIRKIAEEQGFCNARKHDSQDICFVPDGDYVGFMERYTGKYYPDGDFLDVNGNVVGRHHGAVRYTCGQRKGLGLALGAPVYVCGKDMEKNTVTVGPESELFKTTLIAGDFNWISVPELTAPMRVKAKARYRQPEQPATVRPLPDGKVEVEFDEPQRAITRGQAVVLYDGDIVVGGGTIL